MPLCYLTVWYPKTWNNILQVSDDLEEISPVSAPPSSKVNYFIFHPCTSLYQRNILTHADTTHIKRVPNGCYEGLMLYHWSLMGPSCTRRQGTFIQATSSSTTTTNINNNGWETWLSQLLTASRWRITFLHKKMRRSVTLSAPEQADDARGHARPGGQRCAARLVSEGLRGNFGQRKFSHVSDKMKCIWIILHAWAHFNFHGDRAAPDKPANRTAIDAEQPSKTLNPPPYSSTSPAFIHPSGGLSANGRQDFWTASHFEAVRHFLFSALRWSYLSLQLQVLIKKGKVPASSQQRSVQDSRAYSD